MQSDIPRNSITQMASVSRDADVSVAPDWTLQMAATLFTVAVLVHNSDHLRRGGDSVSAQVFWAGSAAIVVEVIVVVAIFLRHPAAPIIAVAAGFGLAVGYLVVHFTPQRGWLSDSLTSGHPSAFTVFAALFETAAAVGLGAAGLQRLRRSSRAGTADPGGGRISLAPVVTHPVVCAMVVGNVVIFVGSLLTRW